MIDAEKVQHAFWLGTMSPIVCPESSAAMPDVEGDDGPTKANIALVKLCTSSASAAAGHGEQTGAGGRRHLSGACRPDRRRR